MLPLIFFMKNKGFTLTEIIITIVILGFMASLALPRYFIQQESVKVSEGVSLAGLYFDAQQRYFLDHSAYTANCALLDIAVTPKFFNAPTCAASGSIVSIQRTGGAYTITVSSAGVYACAACTANQRQYLPK